MGNKQDRTNLGVSPWYSLDELEGKFSTGDIVLFSSRSYAGRSIRWASKSFFNHVGIILKMDPFTDEPFVMDVSVCRKSLFQTAKTNTVLVGSQISTLRSKIYSGQFDLVAVRPLQFHDSAQKLFMNVVLDEIRVQGNPTEEEPHSESGSHSERNDDGGGSVDNDGQDDNVDEESDRDSDGPDAEDAKTELNVIPLITRPEMEKRLNPLTIRMLELSMLQFEIEINREKMEKYYKPTFFDSKLIHGSISDDIGSLVAAEYMAVIFHKLGIFDLGNTPERITSVMSKFKVKHFTSLSHYELPLSNIVKKLEKERYIYLDFQVYEEDLIIRTPPQLPPAFSRAKKSLVRNLYTTDFELQQLHLMNGDLVLISEEGVVADSVRSITNCSWTRVGMVVSFPGLSKPFIYEVPPLYMAQYEFKNIKRKLLEGRVVSLSSIMQNEYYSRVAIRRLEKSDRSSVRRDDAEGNGSRTLRRTGSLNGMNDATMIHACIELSESNAESVEQKRLEQLFDMVPGHYGPDIQFNVSSILSGYYIATCYMQLGLLREITPAELFVKYPVSQFQSKFMTTLQRGYSLSQEIILKR